MGVSASDFYFNGVNVGAAGADSNGILNGSFTEPYLCYCTGNVPVQAIGASRGASASATFYYYTNMTNIYMAPTSGGAGTFVAVFGGGFEPYEPVIVYFNGNSVTTGYADGLGNLTANFNVPNICDFCSGTVPVWAVGQTSGLASPSATFNYSYACCRPGRHVPATQVPAVSPDQRLHVTGVALPRPRVRTRRISGVPPSTKGDIHR